MPVHTQLDMLKVRNDTGFDLPRYSIVELDGAITDDDEITRVHPWQSGIKPTSRCERYASLIRAIKSGDIGDVQVSGPTFALVDITLGDTRCSPKKGATNLVGDDDGPIEILWRPKGKDSGVHECIVEFEQVVPPGTYIAKIPINGIPPRVDLVVGKVECEICRLDPHDYTVCEEKTLVPVLLPGGSPLTKCVYNISKSPVLSEFEPVHRDECGNWLISTVEFVKIKVIDECVRIGSDANGTLSLEAHFVEICVLCETGDEWKACICIKPCVDDESAPTTSETQQQILPDLVVEEAGFMFDSQTPMG